MPQNARTEKGKKVAAIAAAVGIFGGAAAASAFVGVPGTGAAPVTNNPDLTSVTLLSNNAYGTRENAKFCFDEGLQAPFTATNFFIKTYDADRFLAGTAATIDETNTNCVNVTFNPNVDLATQASIGETNANAVRNAGARANYFSSAPVTGSTLKQEAGKTTGPDLVGAVKDPSSTTRVLYTFDQPVDPANVNGALFGVTPDSGTDVTGVPAATVDTGTQREVTVTFPVGTDLGAARFFARQGAVRTRPQDGITSPGGPATTLFTLNPEGVVATGASSRPTLQSAAPRTDGSSQFVVTYDQDLGTFDPTRVVAVLDDGNVVPAASAQAISGSTKQKLVSFTAGSAVELEPSAVVAIVSRTGAATTSNGNLPAPISKANVGPGAPSAPGLTNAPDLLSTTIDSTTSQAIFKYDEPVDKDKIGAASTFVLLVRNGAPILGSSIAGFSADRTQVFVSYGSDVTAAVGVGSAQGAVRDPLGNPSPYSSVSTTLVALPPTGTVPTGTPPPPPPGTTPPPPPPPVATKRAKFRTSISFKIKSASRYSGRVSSSGAGCKSGRRVSLKRSGKTIRKTVTKGNGTFTLARSKGTRGKKGVYAVVSERTTSTKVCTARASKKLKRG